MSDDVQNEPTSITQSTGNIVSVVQVLTTDQRPHPSTNPSPLRKAISDNQQGNTARINDGRRSPRSALHRPKFSTSGAASKSASTAVGATFNAPDTTESTQTVAPVELPSSVGDHCFPRRPNSLPTPRQGVEKADVGRRPASSEQRDGVELPVATGAAVLASTKLTKNNADLTSDVDDFTSPSHKCSSAAEDTSVNTDSVTGRPRYSAKSSELTVTTTSTVAEHPGNSSQRQVLRELKSLFSSIPDDADRFQLSSADAGLPRGAAAVADTGVKVLCTCINSLF